MPASYAEESNVTQDLWDDARAAAEELAGLGTPAGTPESARAGFETFLADHRLDTFAQYQDARLAEDTTVERLDFTVWQQRPCLSGQVEECSTNLPEAMTETRLERCED